MSFKIGDQGPQIGLFIDWLNRKFKSYAGIVNDQKYGLDEARVVAEAMRRYGLPLGPSTLTIKLGGVDTKVEGAIATDEFLKRADWRPPSKPVIFTVAGHMGDMFTGPAYLTARWLEEQPRNLVRVQPIGYENVKIPFDNRSGTNSFLAAVNDPRILPVGTDWATGGHSQGAMILAQLIEDVIRPGKARGQWPWSHWKGGVQWGDPWREKGVVASFVPDPPGANSEGISPRRIVNTPPELQEVARKGDLFADAKSGGQDTEMKRAIFNIVVDLKIFGTDSISEQMFELALNFGPEVWAMFEAIIGAITFAAKGQEPHNVFDLGPSVDHFRRILAV